MGAILSYLFGYPGDDALDSATGLFGKQKRLIRETWQSLRVDSVNTGVTIMIAYFKEYPKYQKAFPSFKDIPVDELPHSKKFQAHCQSIVTTLSNAFDALDDVSLMEATLQITGERHGKRGQSRQDFIDLKVIIMKVLKEALGATFSSEVEEAWDKVLKLVLSKIFEGMEN